MKKKLINQRKLNVILKITFTMVLIALFSSCREEPSPEPMPPTAPEIKWSYAKANSNGDIIELSGLNPTLEILPGEELVVFYGVTDEESGIASITEFVNQSRMCCSQSNDICSSINPHGEQTFNYPPDESGEVLKWTLGNRSITASCPDRSFPLLTGFSYELNVEVTNNLDLTSKGSITVSLKE